MQNAVILLDNLVIRICNKNGIGVTKSMTFEQYSKSVKGDDLNGRHSLVFYYKNGFYTTKDERSGIQENTFLDLL